MTRTNPPERQKESRVRQLSDREEAFCQAILIGKSRTEAYSTSGYSTISKSAIYKGADRLSKCVRVIARLAILRKQREDQYGLNAENVWKQCAAILNADARNYSKWGPAGVTLKDSSELTEAQALAIEEISETVTKDGGTIRYKLHPKSKALEIGAKLLGILIEKQQITGNDGGPIAFTDLDRATKLQRLIALAKKKAAKDEKK